MSIMTGFSVASAQRLRLLWRRIASPVAKRLHAVMSSGLTPQKCALTLCIGIALGTMPIVWGTTLLCIALAHIFRLNHVALQSVNYLLYPLQLALLIPFFKLGAWLFPWGPPIPQHLLSSLIRHPGMDSLDMLGWITLKSLAAWLVTVLPLTLIAYATLWAAASRKVLNRDA
jgi:uncharacterized protein (DUF2062 family)